jgi:hypothetical protein
MLTRKQKLVARALFDGVSGEEMLERYGVSGKQLGKLVKKDEFQEELQGYCDTAVYEMRCTLSRFGPTAALRLVSLLKSEKDDTVRRAALELVDRYLGLQDLPEVKTKRGRPTKEAVNDTKAKAMLVKLAKGWTK